MALLSGKKTRQALLNKGFKIDDGHHHFYLYYYDGKIVAKTRLSHNDQDVNDWLISKMHKQCLISKADFIDLINCPLDEKGYQDKLRTKGVIK